MNKQPVVLLMKESLLHSVLADAVTCGFLLVCIWVSRDQPWWTAFTSLLFAVFLWACISSFRDTRVKSFYRLEEVEAWVNEQKAL